MRMSEMSELKKYEIAEGRQKKMRKQDIAGQVNKILQEEL